MKLKKHLIFFAIVLNVPSSAFSQEILSWQDCILEAKKNNPELISSAEGIKQKISDKNITGSSFFPQFSSNIGYARAKTTAEPAETYSYGVTSSQLIFDGLKTPNDLSAAKANIKYAESAYKFTSSDVRNNLRKAFVNLLKAQELINVTEEIVKIRTSNLELIKLRHQSGLEHKGALLTADANLAQAEYELSQAKRNVELSQEQLLKELGRDKFVPLKVKGDFIVNGAETVKPDFSQLAEINPTFLQAKAKRNLGEFNVKSAKGSFFPTVSADAGTGRNDSVWPPEKDRWNYGVSVTLPLFEGGLKVAELNKAKSQLLQYQADERNALAEVVVALENAWKSFQDALEYSIVQSKAIAAVEERAKIAEAQYSTGFITFDNWIIIQDDLVRAKKSFLEAKANMLLAESEWLKAKGETLEYVQE